MSIQVMHEDYGSLIAVLRSRTRILAAIAGIAILVALPAVISPYGLGLIIACMIAAIGAVGLNLLTGTTGLVSLGQSGFLIVGAYTTGILIADYSWPVPFAIVASGLVAGVISLAVGVSSLRLRELYLAITTLAFAIIVDHVILYANALTHGTRGIFLPALKSFGLDLSLDRNLYWYVLAITLLMVAAAVNIQRSRAGRAFMAIRDHEMAARAMGISLTRWKLTSFFVSSVYAGVAGALMALQYRFINLELFGLLLSIEAIAMIILGGLGSVSGAILGAVFVTLLPFVIRMIVSTFAGSGSGFFSQYVYHIRGISYGVVIIIVLRLAPGGLIGMWNKTRDYWKI